MWKQKYTPFEEWVTTKKESCDPVEGGGLYYIRAVLGDSKGITR